MTDGDAQYQSMKRVDDCPPSLMSRLEGHLTWIKSKSALGRARFRGMSLDRKQSIHWM